MLDFENAMIYAQSTMPGIKREFTIAVEGTERSCFELLSSIVEAIAEKFNKEEYDVLEILKEHTLCNGCDCPYCETEEDCDAVYCSDRKLTKEDIDKANIAEDLKDPLKALLDLCPPPKADSKSNLEVENRRLQTENNDLKRKLKAVKAFSELVKEFSDEE